MLRKGNYLDNVMIVKFFGILHSELFYLKKYKSINKLKKEYRNTGIHHLL